MKRIISAMLLLCMLAGNGAFALTGAEALGLVSSKDGEEAAITSYPVLQLGSRDGDDAGAYVVMLQNRLLELGYLKGGADGQFGAMTETAVVFFQENNGLTPTGIADDATQVVLYSSNAKTAPLVHADADPEILMVQQALANWGFMTGTVDGVIGDDTRSAVAEFKKYLYVFYGHQYAAYATPTPAPAVTLAPGELAVVVDVPLSVTPEPEVNTLEEITPDVVRFASGDSPFQVYQQLLQKGDEGPEVWRLQRRLHQLKYMYKPDGEFGSMTALALEYFQQKNGLPETGAADEATQNALFSGEAVGAEEYVFPYKIGVNVQEQRVYVYGWDGSGYNTELYKFKCSTGRRGYDTPVGIYQAAGKVNFDEWYYFQEYDCYAKFAYRIVGGVMFHSVLFNSHKGGPTSASVRNLGKRASHGCVRLPLDAAEWIWENCPTGTTVVVR